MKRRKAIESGVDWVDLRNEALYIRDRNLLSLIRGSDYVDTIYHFWLHRKPTKREKRMLNAVLVSFCGGWSMTVPVVLSARMAATTKAPIAQCLAAGFCSGGPAHTSAIHDSMRMYGELRLDDIDGFIRKKLSGGERVAGFGHPILKRDPRPPVLRKLYADLRIGGEAIRKYDRIESILQKEKGIYGNIDGINGAILTDLGFKDPSYGPAFFLMSRSLAMTAHIIEEYRNESFKAIDIVFPGFEKLSYRHKGALKDGSI